MSSTSTIRICIFIGECCVEILQISVFHGNKCMCVYSKALYFVTHITFPFFGTTSFCKLQPKHRLKLILQFYSNKCTVVSLGSFHVWQICTSTNKKKPCPSKWFATTIIDLHQSHCKWQVPLMRGICCLFTQMLDFADHEHFSAFAMGTIHYRVARNPIELDGFLSLAAAAHPFVLMVISEEPSWHIKRGQKSAFKIALEGFLRWNI